MGISHPAKSTSFAPACTWKSWNGVCLSITRAGYARRPDLSLGRHGSVVRGLLQPRTTGNQAVSVICRQQDAVVQVVRRRVDPAVSGRVDVVTVHPNER